MTTILEELSLLLCPVGGGLILPSSSEPVQREVQHRLYRATDDEGIQAGFFRELHRIPNARAIILGIPSDVGASVVRGAAFGPLAIRRALLEAVPDWPERCVEAGVVDLGDVFVIPQFLHDDRLSEGQKASARGVLYPGMDPQVTARLPVSPLSMAERVFELVLAVNPNAAPIVLGGDHSTALPALRALSRVRPGWGIVQSDAHSDLLEERLGVKYCYATWSHHANVLLGGGGKLVQVGIRNSNRDRAYWEQTHGVRQFWAEDCNARPGEVLDALVAHVKATGLRSIYFSNDIDGTDERHAQSTGTPEPGGLEPDFVVELIRRLGRDVGLCGGDVMEVAPPVGTPEASERTVQLAVRYLRETLGAIVGRPV
jgi:agmatinase